MQQSSSEDNSSDQWRTFGSWFPLRRGRKENLSTPLRFSWVQPCAGLLWSRCHGDTLPSGSSHLFLSSVVSNQLLLDLWCVPILNITANCFASDVWGFRGRSFPFFFLQLSLFEFVAWDTGVRRCLCLHWTCHLMSTLLDFNSRSKSQFLGLSQTPRLLAALYACTSILQKWLAVINVINATHAHKQWVFKLTFPEVDWSSLLKFYQQDSNSNARCRLVLTTRKQFICTSGRDLCRTWSVSLSRCKRRYSELCCYFAPSWGSSSSVGTTRFVVFFLLLFIYFFNHNCGNRRALRFWGFC